MVSTRPRKQRPNSVRKRACSSILQAYGNDFDVETFLRRVPWRPHRVRCNWWEGPGFARCNGFNLIVTRISRDRPKAIVAAVHRWVVANRRHIERLRADPNVTTLTLDVAINFPDLTPDPQFESSMIRFPPAFQALLSRLHVMLVTSVYRRPDVRRRP